MVQYIDKSAVIAKIRSLQDSTVDEEGNFYTAKAQAEYNILCMFENFLNTLEVKESKVSVSPSAESDESWNNRTKTNVGEAMEELEEKIALYEKNHKKPVSNNLEEAAKIYTISLIVNEIIPDATVKQLREVADKSFKAGAKWQKERMMKDAIEREVKVDAGGYPYIDATELYDYDEDKPLAKEGDKVKLLIIKEE